MLRGASRCCRVSWSCFWYPSSLLLAWGNPRFLGVAMANRDEWPALGRGVPEQARTGVHVRFDAPTPMDRDDGGQRGVPRPRRDVHFNPVGFAFDQPRGPPRGQHFPHRRRGRGNRTHGTQFTPRRTSSSIPKPRELPHLSTSAKRGVDIRQWIVNNNTSNTFRNNSTSKRITFRVMSYNVLAQCNVAEHADLYRGVDNHFLQKTRRKQITCSGRINKVVYFICINIIF